MGAIYPTSLFSNSGYNWLFAGDSKSTIWTKEENKRFEKALAIFDENTPNRWSRIADMIPGKSEFDVKKQYEELLEDVTDIEAGLVPIPGYLASPFTLEWVDNAKFDPFRKRSAASLALSRPHEQERKKGVPWTEEEHRRFLLGLQKHGKGDWRNISRNFVISKTPTQVASHAQKYFLRQSSGGKDKRRPSIHDITTANLSDAMAMHNASETEQKPKSLLDHSVSPGSLPLLHKSINNIMPKMLLDWSNSAEAYMVFDSSHSRQNLYNNNAYQGASAYVGSH